MSACTIQDTASATAVRGPARLFGILALPFRALARHVRIRRTEHQLRELDDRTLADIGLRRSQLLSIAVHAVDRPGSDPRRFWF
jgi:uncharacterized protein YjiS (DUF1127 family)